MRLTWLLPVLSCSLPLCVATAQASQTAGPAPTNRAIWIMAGLGLGAPSSIAAAIELSHQREVHLFSLRSAGLTGADGPVMVDFGLMYGRATRPAKFHASVSIGLGIARWCDNGCSDILLGAIPVAARVAIRGRGVGIGLSAFGDLNTRRSFAGLVLAVSIGKHH